jgi:hypothetical protein
MDQKEEALNSFAPSGNRLRAFLLFLGLTTGAFSMASCGGDGNDVTGLALADLVGTYEMTRLSFDPQGTLPEADILAALGTVPELIVTGDGQAQIVYRDPINALFTTVSAAAKARTTTLRLVPGWENEQLLDPVPGRLRATFQRK